MDDTRKNHPVNTAIEAIIFDMRWMLVISYIALGTLTAAYLGRLVYESAKGAWDIVTGKVEDGVLVVLSGLDAVMVANVAYLILAGSYIVFVKGKISDRVFQTVEERPPAFQHLTPNSLKKKMAGSLIGVSSVDLIQVLLKAGTAHEGNVSWHTLVTKVGIHLTLIVGFIAFHWADTEPKETEEHHA